MRLRFPPLSLMLTGLAAGQSSSEPPETVIQSSVREVLDVVAKNLRNIKAAGPHTAVLFALLMAGLSALLGCGTVTYREIYSSKQPDTDCLVQIGEMCGLSDCTLRVTVSQGRDLQKRDYFRGCVLQFAEVTWTGERVAGFIDGNFCGQIYFAYDFKAHRDISFDEMKAQIAGAIAKDYRVSPAELKEASGDAFAWVISGSGSSGELRGAREFRRRYRRWGL